MTCRILSDEDWLKIFPYLPAHSKHIKGGRPFKSDRACLEGILWILRTGSQWSELPSHFPHYSTCWRRLKLWEKSNTFLSIWRNFLSILQQQNRIDWEESFIDGTFSPAKGGGEKVGKTKRGKGTKLMVVSDGQGVPLAVHIDSASPAEVKLLDVSIEAIAVRRSGMPGRPRRYSKRIIADKAYDCNKIRKSLADRGVYPVIPARSNNRKATHQDGRSLRRYKHRWKIERTISWIQNYRRVVVRYERYAHLFQAFVYLACALITIKKLKAKC